MDSQKRSEDSLLCFVQALIGMRVVVELRFDTIIRGTLGTVDDHMNLTLSAASMQPLQGTVQNLEFLFVKGRNIRYIHLPGSLNAGQVVESHLTRVREEHRMNVRDAGLLSAQ